MRRPAVLLAAALLAATLAPLAPAHGDPASEYLVAHRVFFPLQTPLPQRDQLRLSSLVQDANRRGYRIRVAVIGSRYDLGVEGDVWGKPAEYATNIAEDVGYAYTGRILVVMPSGLGLDRGRDRELLAGIEVGSGTAGLAKAAIQGVEQLAAASGLRAVVPQDVVTQAQRDRHDRIVIGTVAGSAVLLWWLVAALRRRRDAAATA